MFKTTAVNYQLCVIALLFLSFLGTANQWTSVPLSLMRTDALWAAKTLGDLELGVPSPKSEGNKPYFGNHWTPTPSPSSSTPTWTMLSVASYMFSFYHVWDIGHMWRVQMLSLCTIYEETETLYQLNSQSSCFTTSSFPQPSSSLPLRVFVICAPAFSLEGDNSGWLWRITEGQQRISSTARQLYCSNGLRRLNCLSELGGGLETHACPVMTEGWVSMKRTEKRLWTSRRNMI